MFRLLTGVVVAVALLGGARTSAQSPAPAASAQVTAADAAPFLGDWTLTVQGPNGPASYVLTLKWDKEKLVGELSSEMQPQQVITDISKSDKALVLNYSFDYQGTPVPTVLTLTPTPHTMNVSFDFAGGAYEMGGTATKKVVK